MASLPLTSTERKKLRGLAHSLGPVVTVGRRGLSESALGEIEQALADHELIKLRLGMGAELDRAGKRALCEQIASGTSSALAGIVGHIAVFYRPAKDPDQRRVRL